MMRHIQGFEVLLKHNGLRYHETLVPEQRCFNWFAFYDGDDVLQGRFTHPVSQVAIHKNSIDPGAIERYNLEIRFYSEFDFYSANAVQVRVCMKEGETLQEWSTVVWKTDFTDTPLAYVLTREGLSYRHRGRKTQEAVRHIRGAPLWIPGA